MQEIRNEMNVDDPVREEFLTKALGCLMLKNILPAVTSVLFILLYQMVDGILVGRRLGPEALASVNILYPIIALISGLAIMIGVGGNAKIAVLLGKGETSKARSILSLIVLVGIGIGLGSNIIILLANRSILVFLGTSGSLGYFAGEYLNVLHFFFTPMILIFILEQSVRNDGRANFATGLMGATAVLNIFLDYLFLFRFNMGIGGAALATGISQSLGAIIFLGYFINKTKRKVSGLSFGDISGSSREIIPIVGNGSSELFNSIALGITTFIYNKLIINYVGALGVAAFTIVQYIMFIGIAIFIGMANGSQPIISYNFGGGLMDRVYGALKRLLTVSTILSLIIFLIIRVKAESLVEIFIPGEPEAIKLTLRVAIYMSWSILFMPVGIIGSVYFTALEKPKKSLVVAASQSIIFTILGLITFPLVLGDIGIWITPVFAEGVTSLVAILLMYRWKKQNYAY
ncbi:MATE family efflux transporter [Serpentinicella alkaliphila]|uniref:Multidrug export protein MepA n=1 Tax=Serpentinicella alkaliphila TaxID=1734049 RepID=A0A4R2SX11_9FIRM|nr:MATE family efflux transporter [Serpentinicella alkaliphila]QUH26341.1 MATE family efflux transporter [Serpentinicella alkaliphila]TCP95027.1 putative MATE family efflux protein [Serpentinicella alkaliphila]